LLTELDGQTILRSEVAAHDVILRANNLHVHFYTYAGVVKALNGFDLQLKRGEMRALVGESGSGKSVAAWALLALPKRPGRIVEGDVLWHGDSLLQMPPERIRRLRGKEVSLILCNPRSHLHPLLKVGKQAQRVFLAHHKVSPTEAQEATLAMLKAVGLADAKRIYESYPHELSGGMAQRILIAMALMGSPELVIADDATNGLDVTVQRQVLDLMADLIRQHGASTLMITHDLGIVAQYCQSATIMYAGQVVEVAQMERLFENPLHPYTQALLGSIRAAGTTARGKPLPGVAPNPLSLPPGCLLEPRCPLRRPECQQINPPLAEVEPGHLVRCVLHPGTSSTGAGVAIARTVDVPAVETR